MIRCIAVDDEPLSLDILENFIEQTPGIELGQRCNSAFEAMEALADNSIDLIFLDINMPELSGIGLMKSLTDPPLVIFVTAYPEHAIEGFELDALDYLLKPFSIERFMKAVNKAKSALASKNSEGGHIMIKADKRLHRIPLEEIIMVQAIGDYAKVICTNQTLITNQTLKEFIHKLPGSQFVQVHKSY